jgi:hypothetical protein
MENHNFNGTNPLFLWPFSIAMLVYQRVPSMPSMVSEMSPWIQSIQWCSWCCQAREVGGWPANSPIESREALSNEMEFLGAGEWWMRSQGAAPKLPKKGWIARTQISWQSHHFHPRIPIFANKHVFHIHSVFVVNQPFYPTGKLAMFFQLCVFLCWGFRGPNHHFQRHLRAKFGRYDWSLVATGMFRIDPVPINQCCVIYLRTL